MTGSRLASRSKKIVLFSRPMKSTPRVPFRPHTSPSNSAVPKIYPARRTPISHPPRPGLEALHRDERCRLRMFPVFTRRSLNVSVRRAVINTEFRIKPFGGFANGAHFERNPQERTKNAKLPLQLPSFLHAVPK